VIERMRWRALGEMLLSYHSTRLQPLDNSDAVDPTSWQACSSHFIGWFFMLPLPLRRSGRQQFNGTRTLR